MPSIKTYTPEENLRRIKMQKNTAFVVVEGSDDVPIYEAFINKYNNLNLKFDIIFSGGKTNIKKFIENYKSKNSIFVLDKDFDNTAIKDERVIFLERYSIENYFICEEVISAALSFVFKCKKEDAKIVFSLAEYEEEISNSLRGLLKIIYYYQKILVPNQNGIKKTAWSDFFLCENNTWKISNIRVSNLIAELIPDNRDLPKAENEFHKTEIKNEPLTKTFPGKMLKTSLQRYIQNKIKEIKPSAKSHFGDIESMRTILSSNIHHSNELRNALKPVEEFLIAQRV